MCFAARRGEWFPAMCRQIIFGAVISEKSAAVAAKWQSGLLVDEQLRVANHVDKQDASDLESGVRRGFRGHGRSQKNTKSPFKARSFLWGAPRLERVLYQ